MKPEEISGRSEDEALAVILPVLVDLQRLSISAATRRRAERPYGGGSLTKTWNYPRQRDSWPAMPTESSAIMGRMLDKDFGFITLKGSSSLAVAKN